MIQSILAAILFLMIVPSVLGNPGTFLTKVYVFKDIDKAFILFANSQTEDTNTGLDVLYAELKRKYGR